VLTRLAGAAAAAVGLILIVSVPTLAGQSLRLMADVPVFAFAFGLALVLMLVLAEPDREAGRWLAAAAVLGAGAVGSALGAAIAPAVQGRIGIGRTYMLGAVLFPAPLVLVPLADGPLWLIAALLFLSEFGAGVGVMLFDVSGNSLQLVLIPQRIRARTAGTHRTINYGVRPLGALLGGFLGSAIGLRPTLWIATVGAAVSIVWLVFSPVPGVRELPAQAE
jgi:predicted MFS family arabinose efflux permease